MPLPDSLPYFPRPDLLQSTLRLLLSGANVTLFAPRRHGKTQFVRNELLPAVHEAGWFAARVDLWRNRAQPAKGLVEGLEAIAYADKPQRLLGMPLDLHSIRTKFHTPGVDIEGEWVPSPSAAQPVPDATLENRLAHALGRIASHGKHTLLALDEFQALAAPEMENFIASFRTVLQDLEGRLSVIFTGSSREGLMRLFQRAKAPLFRSATAVELPNLGDGFVDSRADYLADMGGLQVDRDALKACFRRLGFTPLFLNELARDMLVSRNPDVPLAYRHWVAAKRSGEYATLIDALRNEDLALVLWLATSGESSVYTTEARQAMAGFMGQAHAPEIRHVQGAIRRLTKEGIIDPMGAKGAYVLADQGLQIILTEVTDALADRRPARPG